MERDAGAHPHSAFLGLAGLLGSGYLCELKGLITNRVTPRAQVFEEGV